ncbi:MAG: putative glycosyl transferase family 2 [Mycobacterium sp.]|jgi:glycosyltransferase involved in cell wall biosynthesis|nr:putative glycosyl transferase family 2 [Mycobacterium sp.]
MNTTGYVRSRQLTPAVAALQKIVVVIPAHDEADRLPACLASVAAAADAVNLPVTVVVVLDACTDHSEEVVGDGVRVLRVSVRNVGAARAAGFAAASAADPTTWLACTDADCVVPTRWLADQVAAHVRSFQAVAGTVAVDWREHSVATQRLYDRLYRAGAKRRRHGHVHGANLGVRADVYWRVGGFRPLPVGEDVDLVARLAAADIPLIWDDRNVVLTSDRRNSRAPGGFGDFVTALAEQSEGADVAARSSRDLGGS